MSIIEFDSSQPIQILFAKRLYMFKKSIINMLTNRCYFPPEDNRFWKTLFLNVLLLQIAVGFFILGVLSFTAFYHPKISVISFFCCAIYFLIFIFFQKTNNLEMSNAISMTFIVISLSFFVMKMGYQHYTFFWFFALIPYVFFMSGIVNGLIISCFLMMLHLTDLYISQIVFEGSLDAKGLSNIIGASAFVGMEILFYEYSRSYNFSLLTKHKTTYQQLSVIDNLTGIYNRSQLDKILTEKIERSLEGFNRAYLVLIGIDHLRKVNVEFGYAKGDEVLVQVSNIVQSQISSFPNCSTGRWGADQFMVVTDTYSHNIVHGIVEAIREEVEKNNVLSELGVTVSIGITAIHETDKSNTLVKRTDDALTKAKQAGRNQVILNIPSPS